MNLRYLQDRWNETDTQGMDEADLLRYRSNLLGADLRLTNFGGGNTSAKIVEQDPITGESVLVLWVKGSGGDLGTIQRDGFATLYQDRLLALKGKYQGVHEEDAMADKYALCTFANNPRAASIDTPLHGFLPYKHVDHLHPDWAIALAACGNGPEQLNRLESESGIKLAWLPWKRPGFELGLWLEEAVIANPGLDGVILGSHGLFTWGGTSRESYLNTLRVIDGIGSYLLPRIEAKGKHLFGGAVHEPKIDREELANELLPVLRGHVGSVIGHFDGGETVLQFVNSARAKALAWQGTSCPDHFVRTKVRPLFIEWDGNDVQDVIQAIPSAFADYQRDYEAYYEANKRPDSPAMRSASPTVVLIPGIGMFSFGKSKAEARITGEFYVNAIHVMEGATALDDALPAQSSIDPNRIVDNYVALPPSEAFNIEYWALEEAKLKRMPPEKPLSRKVAVLVGASPGIGHHVVEQLLTAGAHVAVADINPDVVTETVTHFQKKFGHESVTGISVDITEKSSVAKAFRDVIRNFGGVDIVINLAAIFITSDSDTGQNTEAQWRKTLDINLVGNVTLAYEAQKIISKQRSNGSIVLTSSANGVVPKKGSLAYDVSKSALNHLVRELALELSPHIRVNAVAPATVVEGSQQFPRERVVSSLAKYQIDFAESESLEDLRSKLAHFYATRTLLKVPVSPAKVAESIVHLASDSTSLTTGHIFPVDAGLAEAFLR